MKALLAFVVLWGMYSNILSMECAEVGRILDPQILVFDIFLKNQNKRLSHEIICTLAQVSRSWKKCLLDTVPERKKYLLRKLEQQEIKFHDPYFFNKYGSLLCDKGLRSKTLEIVFSLQGYFLNDENKVKMFDGEWDPVSDSVISLPRPFLTPSGALCCYGWRKYDSEKWGSHHSLTEYCVMPNNKKEIHRCGLKIDRYGDWALSHFIALPNLLNAFVNSSVVCSFLWEDITNADKLFVLKDAIIPDNYAEYQESNEKLLNRTFNQLPTILRNAIIARYEECKKQRMIQLFAAIKEHKNEEVKQIISEFPACVNAYQDYECDSKILFGEVTPLHVAVYKNNVECVELLLSCQADCNAQTKGLSKKDTPLHVAQKAEIANMLIQAGASVKIKNRFGHTPLYVALFGSHRFCCVEVAQCLVDAGADINERLLKNSTLLHKATMSSWVEKRVMFLLKNGADRTLRDDDGETALEFSQARDSILAQITLACFEAVPERK